MMTFSVHFVIGLCVSSGRIDPNIDTLKLVSILIDTSVMKSIL